MLKLSLPQILSVRTAIGLSLIGLIALSLWTVGIWVYENNLSSLSQRLNARINLYSSNINSELEKYEYLPVLLSKDPILKRPFEVGANPGNIHHANLHLSALRETAGVSEIYLLDDAGSIMATSNWNESDSFMGQNFKFRPYFQNALDGERGLYFALGSTSRIPGYYLSYPMVAKGRVQGVVVVKGSVAGLENAWAIIDETVLISDENGVIIIASQPAWKFHTFQPLSEGLLQQLSQTRQYDQAALSMLDIQERVQIDRQTERIELMIPQFVPLETTPQSVYIRSRPISGTDWQIHYVYKEAGLQKDVIEGLIFATILWMVLILGLLYLFQRRRLIENKLQFQLQHQRTLEQAAATLEARVERRTKALKEANLLLEKEIDVRLEAEKNLTRTQDELVQAGKLAALGQMAAGITHEMNQPLSAIRSYSDNAHTFLKRGKTDEAQANLGLIAQLCERLGVITNQLKVFSRKAPQTFEPVSLQTIIDESLKIVQAGQWPSNLKVTSKLEDPTLKVMGEAIRLEQVLINILKNAMDALEQQDDPFIEIYAKANDARIRVMIRDNGPGIEQEKLKKIFDPFFTTKASGKGLGLGLSLSSQIIQEFSGTLTAKNHPDGGMIFTLDLMNAYEVAYG